MRGHRAAQIARDAATGRNEHYLSLSSKMCWDAVAHCQQLAGAHIGGGITSDGYNHVISLSDPTINNRSTMWQIPQGSFIGFFDNTRLIHAMIAVGFGMAAGNKNACIGIGAPIGWEILDLAGRLGWGGAGATVGNRALGIRYRILR